MDTAILIIAYEAAATIEKLLDRVPTEVAGKPPFLLISDDASTDDTSEVARQWLATHPQVRAKVVHQPTNLGYGGNQKFCFQWAVDEGFDVGVLLHGDEQYPPEMIDELVRPIVTGEADAVYGSRMMTEGGARDGGMPMDRYVGNRVLSRVFNWFVGTDFTEWFSGFRAYSTDLLASSDLHALPQGFDFDVAITIEAVASGRDVIEIPIPTHYGDELSRVPLLRTGLVDLSHAVDYWRDRRRERRA